MTALHLVPTTSGPPTRPALRYHGGKWLLAPWIIAQFPPHRVYVEPFGGAASVLLRKPRSYAEIYNDRWDEVVNLFRVLRTPEHAAALVSALELTPFARAEFEGAYEPVDDPVERARRLIVLAYQGFGSTGVFGRATGFRANSSRSGTTPARDWLRLPEAYRSIIDRVAGVVVENRPAIDVMLHHDSEDTLHYVDPPYMPQTRGLGNMYCTKHLYPHDMTAEEHRELLAVLRSLTGAVVLSGYPSALYDEALAGWTRITRDALADGARPRTEVLWLNPRACAGRRQTELFGGGA